MRTLVEGNEVMRGFLVWLMVLSMADQVVAADYEEHVYKKVGGVELVLYVVKPPGWTAGDRRPAVVWFHGGGWFVGSPTPKDDRGHYLAERGMVSIDVRYRLIDRNTLEPPLVCVQDAKSAMRWVRSHAESLGIDPQRIAASGASAGGHLAAFTGMVDGLDDPQDDLKTSARPDALLLYKPVIDNGPDQGYGQKRIKERYPEFSPAHNITPDDPPTLIVVGTKDQLIPVGVMQRFQANMQKAGVRCELVILEGQEHNFPTNMQGSWAYYETLRATDQFLASLGWLKGEPTLRKVERPTADAPTAVESPE